MTIEGEHISEVGGGESRQTLRRQDHGLGMLRALETSVGTQCEGDPSSQIDLVGCQEAIWHIRADKR